MGVSQGGVIRGGCVSWRDSGCVPERGNKRRGCELEG